MFFLFYFNRLFATIISYAIRAYTWRKYNAYIDIHALQISLLGGRIFFKDIRYHAHNQTILVHGGYITWNYWLRNVKQAELFQEDATGARKSHRAQLKTDKSQNSSRSRSLGREERGGNKGKFKLPCRISVKLSGVEIFLYNRSPVYDSIVENIAKRTGRQGGPEGGNDGNSGETSGEEEKSQIQNLSLSRQLEEVEDSALLSPSDPPSILRIFPIYVECNKGAVAIGNEFTSSILTVQFERAWGEFNAGRPGPLDIYRQLFNFEFTRLIMHIKPNADFKCPQLAAAMKLKKGDHLADETTGKENFAKNRGHKSANVLRNLSIFINRSVNSVNAGATPKKGRNPDRQSSFPGQDRWLGLSRYLDETQHDEHDEWQGVEYAKSSLVVDCPHLAMSFYWDVGGPVTAAAAVAARHSTSGEINGAPPPAYGLDLFVHGGIINYGPWADRQRANLQSFFFPATYTDAIPAEPVRCGQSRVASVFKIFISIEEETVLRVPVKEPSKDWKWKGKAKNLPAQGNPDDDKVRNRNKGKRKPSWLRRRPKNVQGPNVRPFAWLDIKVPKNTSVNYTMDMFARPDGYHNHLDLDVPSLEIFTSVNHGLLWRSGLTTLDCNLSNPLEWNALRSWTFKILNSGLELFILRDHLFLLIDLIGDWGSGPLAEFLTFVPFKYYLDIRFEDFKLYLNANDSNIINNPSDLDDNNFMIIAGKSLASDLVIPLDKFRTAINEVPFDVRGKNLSLTLRLPPRNTVHTYLKSKTLATLEDLKFKGSHSYYSDTRPGLTDTLHFDVFGSKFSLTLFGFLIDHFMKLKENYFGEDLHFSTLEEFQSLLQRHLAQRSPEKTEDHFKKTNDLDVILTICVEDANAILPGSLYDANEGCKIEVPYANADLRFTNYYMDLGVNLSPLSVSLMRSLPNTCDAADSYNKTEIFIDSFDVYGHRLFGLPPTEPTYVCQWEFSIGKVYGECSSDFLCMLIKGGRFFAYTLDDDENALRAVPLPIIHDVTYLRLATCDINVWLHVADEAFLLSCGPIELDFNDLAETLFSQRLNILVPNIVVACVDVEKAFRRGHEENRRRTTKTFAYLNTSLTLNMVRRKPWFEEEKQKQQDHIISHDRRTARTDFLISSRPSQSLNHSTHTQTALTAPAMPFPPMPQPVIHKGMSLASSFNASLETFKSKRGQRNTLGRAASFAVSLHSFTSSSSINREDQPDSGADEREAKQPSFTIQRTSISQHHLNTDYIQSNEGHAKPSVSVAISSPLARPGFILQKLLPDLKHVPTFPKALDSIKTYADADISLDSFQHGYFKNDYAHMSFMVKTKPGIRGYLTPQAIKAVAALAETIDSTQPGTVVDMLHINVMSDILDLQKRKEGEGKLTEVNLKIPHCHIRFCNAATEVTSQTSIDEDQYNVIFKNLITNARLKSMPDKDSDEKSVAFHTSLNLLSADVRELKNRHPSSNAGVEARISDVIIWAASSTQTSLNVSFRDFEIFTSSEEIAYNELMIMRAKLLAEELQPIFESLKTTPKSCRAYVGNFLTITGSEAPDPIFLSRPTYGVRAASEHLRMHDSWKVISRMRYLYQTLSDAEKNELESICAKKDFSTSITKETQEALSFWEKWRSWDVTDIRDSSAMKWLFGPANAPKKSLETHGRLVQFDMRSRLIRLVLDTGSKQSEAKAQFLSISMAHQPASNPSGLMLVEASSTKASSALQITSRSISADVNFEILTMVETIVDIIGRKRPTSRAKAQSMEAKVSPTQKKDHILTNFQALIVVEKGDFVLQSKNVSLSSMSRGLRLSLAANNASLTEDGTSLCGLIHANIAGVDVSTSTRRLMQSYFDGPNLYISKHIGKANTEDVERWSVAGMSQKLTTEIIEEPLGLVEVLNDMVLDEGHRLVNLKDKFTSLNTIQTRQELRVGPELTIPSITVSLSLNSYAFDAAIIPGLAYSLAGRSGRISASPFRTMGKISFDVNYDLDTHSHGLFDTKEMLPKSITTFTIPPINGRLTFERGVSQSSIEISCAIEAATLELSAVHGLLTIFSIQQVSETGRALQHDVCIVQSHIRELMAPDNVSESTLSAKENPLSFSANVVLSGLKIVARAPCGEPPHDFADFTFKLNDTHLRATNVSQGGSTILRFPDIKVNLGHIGAAMTLHSEGKTKRCGSFGFGLFLHCTSTDNGVGGMRMKYGAFSKGFLIDIYAETASAIASVIDHLQGRLKNLNLERERKYLRRLRRSRRANAIPRITLTEEDNDNQTINLLKSAISFEMLNIQICWIVAASDISDQQHAAEDLVLSCQSINLSTRKEGLARLTVNNTQLQLVSQSFDDKVQRSGNSILLPQVVLNVAYDIARDDIRLAFHAAGKPFDILLDSRFIIPASMVQQSMALAQTKLRSVSASWKSSEPTVKVESGDKKDPKGPLGKKKLSSLLIHAEFAGAVIHLKANPDSSNSTSLHNTLVSKAGAQQGRKEQLGTEGIRPTASLQAPGVALKVEYKGSRGEPSLTSELKIEPSSNTLYPTVVPLIVDITNSIKEVVKDDEEEADKNASSEKSLNTVTTAKVPEEDNIINADPAAILGGTRLNFGLRICKQEFSLSCQPIARVAATAQFEDIYATVNSVKSADHGSFFAISASVDQLQMSVKHVYSTDSTFSFEIESIMLSLLNSKHLSGTSGISAILKFNPARTLMNVRQLQDFLIFREIWLPPEIRRVSKPPSPTPQPQTQDYLVQRYQQVTAAAAFPWTVTVSLAQLFVELDLGQALGTTSLRISELWASSRKNSDWEQNLCVGLGQVRIESIGRMSGFVDLSNFRVRTSIRWPLLKEGYRQTPLVQASATFDSLRLKTAFDQQVFAIADISGFSFLMYNVRDETSAQSDRLVSILEGDKVHAFMTATSASNALALYQAIEKLIQEARASYTQSLRDIEKSLRRTSMAPARKASSQSVEQVKKPQEKEESPITLHTDVVVSLKSLKVGAFPGTFFDSQLFSADASDVQARFAVAVEDGHKLHTALGMTLGRFNVALAAITQSKTIKPPTEISVDEIIKNALGARGGTILRVPKVIASMQTWQKYDSSHIEYIFKSLFEGKIDVGWNYSRISFIRSMYNNHTRALAMRLGKPPPEPAVKITAPEQPATKDGPSSEGEKITAVVNVPQSKYDYTALEPPIIDTPQLRDMGEATPPLEWIGLHRDRLPNVTHQIVIVTLLEIAKEVEDAYGRILGSS